MKDYEMSEMQPNHKAAQDWQNTWRQSKVSLLFLSPELYADQEATRLNENVHQKAIRLYIDGMGLRRIGRQLGVHHQNVANWTKAHAEKLPKARSLPR